MPIFANGRLRYRCADGDSRWQSTICCESVGDTVEACRVPIVVIEEILRGRLNSIRQAESGKSKISVDVAYAYLQRTIEAFRRVSLLPYPSEAEAAVKEWRQQKIRGSTHDLRIAASCVVQGATLISRNRRDFEGLPNLKVEFWG